MLPITWWPSHCYLKSFEAGNLKLLSVPLSHLSCWVLQPFLLQFPLTLQSIQTGTRRRESRTTQSPRKIAQIVFQHCHRGNFRAWRSGGFWFFFCILQESLPKISQESDFLVTMTNHTGWMLDGIHWFHPLLNGMWAWKLQLNGVRLQVPRGWGILPLGFLVKRSP